MAAENIPLFPLLDSSVKYQWQKLDSAVELATLANWSQQTVDKAKEQYWWEKIEDVPVAAIVFIQQLGVMAEGREAFRHNHLSPYKKNANDAVFLWLHLYPIASNLQLDRPDDQRIVLDHLSRFLDAEKRTQEPGSLTEEASLNKFDAAFTSKEKHTVHGKTSPSQFLYHRILEDAASFDPDLHLAPYTSVVGPSGIGKSRCIRELAVTHGLPVVYVSFAAKTSTAYPPQTPVAESMIPMFYSSFARLEKNWERVLNILSAFAETAMHAGFTPAGLFNLQTRTAYAELQRFLATEVDRWIQLPSECGAEVLADQMGKFRAALTGQLAPLLDAVKGKKENEGSPCTSDVLVFAFDEAKCLLQGSSMQQLDVQGDSKVAIPFRSLRSALRAFHKTSVKRVFGLFLDTSSHICNFSPPAWMDPSQKWVKPSAAELFEPVYAIDTRDIFVTERIMADDTFDSANNERLGKHLLQFGRPLWGALLQAGMSPSRVLHLACAKTNPFKLQYETGQVSSVGLAALLSYRLELYTADPVLSEQLVSGWLRYIATISLSGAVLKTLQPGEPALACAASLHLRQYGWRKVLQGFIGSANRHVINVGDTGEMAAAMILLMAMDSVHPLRSGTFGLVFPRPVTVRHFLDALLGLNAVIEIAQANENSAALLEAQVFFNHFMRLQSGTTLDNTFLAHAFSRCAAFFVPTLSSGIDLLIPVRNQTFTDMTYIAVQVKNCANLSNTKSVRQLACNSIQTAYEQLPKLQTACLGLIMCLRDSADASDPTFILATEKPERRSSRVANKAKRAKIDSGLQQYPVVGLTFGMTPATFPCMAMEDGSLVELLRTFMQQAYVGREEAQSREYLDHLREEKFWLSPEELATLEGPTEAALSTNQ